MSKICLWEVWHPKGSVLCPIPVTFGSRKEAQERADEYNQDERGHVVRRIKTTITSPK